MSFSSPQNEWVKVSEDGSSSNPSPSSPSQVTKPPPTDVPLRSRSPSPPVRLPSRGPSPLSQDPRPTQDASSPVGHPTQPRLVSPAPSVGPISSIDETTTKRGRHDSGRRRRPRFQPLSSSNSRSPSRTPRAFRASSPPEWHSYSRMVSPGVAPTNSESESTQEYRRGHRNSRHHRFCPPESTYAMRFDGDRSREDFLRGRDTSSVRSEQYYAMHGGNPYSNPESWMRSTRIGSTWAAPRSSIDTTQLSDYGRANLGELIDPFTINRLLGTRSLEYLQRSGEMFATLEYIGARGREYLPLHDPIYNMNEEIMRGYLIALRGGQLFWYDTDHPHLVNFWARMDLADALENDEDGSVASGVRAPYGDVNTVSPGGHFYAINGGLLIVPRNGREPFQLRRVEYRLGTSRDVTIFPTDGTPPTCYPVNTSHGQQPGYFQSLTLYQ